ncbi:preprotein translocase subunit YajC [Isoptericola sp. CG 20/1183]|uniref:Preprotein translocase subunit YajC n=1 Tax=Isoptericola halotolerans TaxID=300560 RepID=A0ABX5EDN7_9MICO|nr:MULTISPECIES: preprotein translocase subunit YajC [Isoptericola]MCK0115544.1 preprotein translocase subunit YajC [Isoptericola sp. S6320L]PRZ04380.1 preprotein translocase subunit YajC [Isoptericola halotolerans]PRZ04722.1 preprotein translocase subunit YajC [Isoptericola sp. CG 20/1183]
MDFSIIILFVVLAALMFFMSSRTRKQQKQQAEFRAALAPGQEVMTGSGMVGTVVEIDDESDTVTIETTPGTRTRWLRAAVAKRTDTAVEAEDAEETDTTGTSDDAGSIASADGHVEVPDDLSGLDTAQREHLENKRRENGETEDK